MVNEQQLTADLEHALNCVLCWCGNFKRIGKPFCFQCFDSLPRNWRDILTASFQLRSGNVDPLIGAHEYDAALHYLQTYRAPATVYCSLKPNHDL